MPRLAVPLDAMRSGRCARRRFAFYVRRARARRHAAELAEARERLGGPLFAKVRRHAIRARRSWRESEAVFLAAMLRLFLLARKEVAQGLAGPYRLRRA